MKIIFEKQRLAGLFLAALMLFGFNSAIAQTDNSLGTWEIFVLKGNLNKKVFFTGEFNIRNNNFHSTYDYCEYKGGIGYSLTKSFGILVGAGGYNSSLTGSFLNTVPSQKEFRIWLDLLLRNSYKRLNFDHRMRFEQRYTSVGNKQRLRYRLTLTVPVNKPTLSDNTFFVSSSDELFFGQSHPSYEKNRFYIGAGYKLNNNFTFHLGNMHQSDYKSSYSLSKNYLKLMIIYNLTHKAQNKHLTT